MNIDQSIVQSVISAAQQYSNQLTYPKSIGQPKAMTSQNTPKKKKNSQFNIPGSNIAQNQDIANQSYLNQVVSN